MVDDAEDDLDDFNLDIQQDLVAAGEKYLKMFKKKKNKHKDFRNAKKAEVQRLLNEIEELMGMLSSSAQNGNMHCIDDMDDDRIIDDGTIKEKIQREMELDKKRDEDAKAEAEEKKEQIYSQANDRDKDVVRNALDQIHSKVNDFNKEMNEGDGEQENQVSAEHAIYDNQDVNSRANKFVAMIEQNQNLTAEEKERLLKNQEENEDLIGELLAKDKASQEMELDRLLKERLDRRRRLKEKQHAKEIAKETMQAQNEVDAEFKPQIEAITKQLNEEEQALTQKILDTANFADQSE